LPKDSAANVSQILALNRSLLSERAGRLAPKQLAQFSTGSMSSSADDFAVFVPYFAEGEPLPPPDEDLVRHGCWCATAHTRLSCYHGFPRSPQP
jgi:hypothetical protein